MSTPFSHTNSPAKCPEHGRAEETFGTLRMEPGAGAEGSLNVCPLSSPPSPAATSGPSRPLPGSQHAPLGLENNPQQQEYHLSPKSQGQMGTARRSLCCKGRRSPCGYSDAN